MSIYKMYTGEAIFIECLLILIVAAMLYQAFSINQDLRQECERLRGEIRVLNSNADTRSGEISICRSMAASLWHDYYTRFPTLGRIP